MPADAAKAVLRAAHAQGLRVLDEPTAKALLASFGVTTPATRVVRSAAELEGLDNTLRSPYVLKAVSPQIVHKSDVGAVRVGLRDARELAMALDEMRMSLAAKALHVEHWLVEEMAPPGVECVIGGVIDPEFGPMVMAGLGGVFVEVMRDVSFRICPIERREALEMLGELRGAPILRGTRGQPPVSLEAFADALVRIGGEGGVLLSLAGELAEIDVNPLIVTGERAIAVDVRIVLNAPASGSTP